ncbi:uncharacterized protein LOC126884080 isoform X1 [Diabrotica virgifera virgifera]|uniref:CobW/HypB/UreG nucleotide-binding domain-containing protein n=1 Tax=Diabrotica virgifera virgifera TaxID=50390 RepID=A0ABM5K6J8_DIAVI|nr:uncharacterized protein LOC126884080 isoform X1 [Diabrotica virgifera virgifera]XP_050505819.1 uncharacterized protein LOC126884080 isoform X2 [Diabrotica virgifera virgifera]XP_050505820.1 uncharacterized protein LOC126884080 isoform X1 [Diabrotica virgifera virgifera]XP_050505821.1 uncharacterized protein LOC126884080 isoform X1 [Diabrotica virgifera virgifera]
MDPDNADGSNLRKKSVPSKDKQTRKMQTQKAVGEYPKGPVANLGTDYEWKLHCLFAVAAFKHFDNWSLANEYIEAGKFDDLVFKINDQCLLLQAKFKENKQVSDQHFWSTNPKSDNFSIYKYILSYNDIKWKFKGLKTNAIVLCTNANLPDSTFNPKRISENNIVNKIFGNQVEMGSIREEHRKKFDEVKTYQENISDVDKDKVTWKTISLNHNDIEEFMSKFIVIKVSIEQIDKQISYLIMSMEKKNPSLKNLYIINHVHYWRNLGSKHSVYMTKNYMRFIWYREENDRCIQQFLNYEISFLNPYQFLLAINLIKVEHNLDLYLTKIVNSINLIYKKQDKPDEMFFKEVLFLAIQSDYKTIENTVECFKIKNVKYLVVSFLEMDENQSKEIYIKISRILDTNKQKKVIIVAENFGFQDTNVENDQIRLNLFDENTKEIVYNTIIEFQGEAVTLKHLLNNFKVANLMDGCKSIDIMDKSYISSLFKSAGESCDLNRESYKELVESIKNKLSNDAPDLRNPTVLEFQGQQIVLDDLVTICKIEYLTDELFVLQLIKKESLSLGKYSIPSTTSEKYYVPRLLSIDFQNLFSEEFLLNELNTINKKVAVLTGPLGAGKTTLLENIILSRKLNDQKCSRLTWIINIELSKAAEYLQNKSLNPSLLGLLSYSEDTRGHFEIQALKSIEKIIVIDGIDENNSEYIHEVQDLIKNCPISENLNILLVIMACRNYDFILKKIRNKPDVETIVVEPFNEQDQEMFFEKYVTFKNATSVQKTKKVFFDLKAQAPGIKKFCSTPFALRLLIDILLNNEDHLEHISKIFSKSLSVYEFYKLFLEEKKKSFVQQQKWDRCVINSIVTDAFDTYLTKTRKFAASKSLPRELQELFNTDISPSINPSMLSIGIFEEKNGEFKFIHKSFEEYFAAEYIWNCLSHKRISDSILLALLNKLFLNTQYAGVSGFFEEILITKISDRGYNKISKEFGRVLSEQRWVESISLLVFQGYFNIVKFVFHEYDGFSKVINHRGTSGETALHLSAHYPHLVKYLVENGAEINCVDENGMTIFHYIIMMCWDSDKYKIYFNMIFEKMKYRDNFKTITFFDEYLKLICRDQQRGIRCKVEYDVILDLIDYLTDCGLDLSVKDKDEDTSVHWATQAGFPTLLKTLIEKYKLEYTAVDKYGYTPLHYACQFDSLGILEYFEQSELLCVNNSSLVSSYKPPTTVKILNDLDQQTESLLLKNKYLNLSAVDNDGASVIHRAASGNAVDILIYLINKYKLNPKLVDKYGNTPLHEAGSYNSLEAFTFLLETAQLDVNDCNNNGNSVLYSAAGGNAVKIIKYLYSKDEYKHLFEQQNNDGDTIIHSAARGDATDALTYLIFTCKLACDVTDKYGNTPLHSASSNDALEAFKYLLVQAKLDVNQCNERDESVVHKAAYANSMNVLKFLIDVYKLSPKLVDELGNTPLHDAAYSDSLEALKFLLQSEKIDVNDGNNVGDTVLHKAAFGNATKVIEYLHSQPAYAHLFNITNKMKDTALHTACIGNSIDALTFLVNRYPCLINSVDEDGNTPLHEAAFYDSLESFKQLLQCTKLDINIRNKESRTVLHLAAGQNSMKVLKFLIDDRYPCLINSVDEYGNTPLHEAAFYDSLESVKQLLQCTKLDINIRNTESHTVLHLAAGENSMKVLKFLIDDYKLSPKLVNEYGNTPLNTAAYNDSLEAFKYLLQSEKINVNDCNNMGDTVLHCAAYRNSTEIIEYLHSDPAYARLFNIKNKIKQTALHAACKGNSVDALSFIVDNYPHLINSVDEDGYTPFHEAAFYDSLESFKYLLQCTKLDVKICNQRGETVLHRAALGNSMNVLKFLIDDYKLSLKVVDITGNTPLHYSAVHDDTLEAFKYLLQSEEINVNDCNNRGNTVLHLAAFGNATKIIEYLHSDPDYKDLFNTTNKMKQSALHTACQKNSVQALAFFVNNYPDQINSLDEDGNTPLHEAAFYDSFESFTYLLECTTLDIKTCNQKGETVLHSAACENSMKVLKYLIDECNMSPTVIDIHGDTPLHVAAFNNSVEAFTYLLKTEKLNINDCNDKGDSVLHKAVHGKAIKVIEVIFTSFMQ